MPDTTLPIGSARGVLVRSRWLIAEGAQPVREGGLWIVRGRIEGVLRSPGEVRACQRRRSPRMVDLGDALVAPGFVDAHAHLELSALAARVPAGRNFAAWIRTLIAERGKTSSKRLAAGARAGADALLASGTTLVADIDSLGLLARALRGHPLRRIPFHELLDARDPARTRPALARAHAALRAARRLGHGLSPHAPTTVSAALASGIARLAKRRRARVMVHWAETAEEERWLESGEGPLAALLGASPLQRGLDLLEAAGLLGRRTLLVHGNLARPDERERVARAGAVLVHCPGTHAFFARPRFALGAWRSAGARLALGTDSLASNGALDMRAEIAQLLRTQPALHPREAWLLGTRDGAEALGLAQRAGELRRGAFADFAVFGAGPARAGEIWEHLCRPGAPVREVWIAGKPVFRAALEPEKPLRS
ncbi:MAG: amidohydrolase family protein [Planctomycetes bacterium]|nr:amidohydrolase family protein [Planctomycetota bacterium]